MTKQILSLIVLAAMLWLPAPICAQIGAPATGTVCPVPGQPLDPQLNHWLTELVKQHLPHRYDRDKDWGGQATRWDGLSWQRENGIWRPRARRKSVNHGTWRKYSLSLRQPDKGFEIQLRQCREPQPGQAEMTFQVLADLNLEARESKWVKGVQLYSVSASGHTKVALDLTLQLDFAAAAQLPPALQVHPRVTSANLEVLEFRIDRISKAGGELTQQLSKWLSGRLQEEVAEREDDLIRKLNEKLTKDPQRWQLSLSWPRSAAADPPAKPQEATHDSIR